MEGDRRSEWIDESNEASVLDRLDRFDRFVLQMHWADECTVDEMALVLGVSGACIHRSLERIRAAVSDAIVSRSSLR